MSAVPRSLSDAEIIAKTFSSTVKTVHELCSNFNTIRGCCVGPHRQIFVRRRTYLPRALSGVLIRLPQAPFGCRYLAALSGTCQTTVTLLSEALAPAVREDLHSRRVMLLEHSRPLDNQWDARLHGILDV